MQSRGKPRTQKTDVIEEEGTIRAQTVDKGKRPIQSISSAQQDTVDDMPNQRRKEGRIGESDPSGWEENSDNDFEDLLQVRLPSARIVPVRSDKVQHRSRSGHVQDHAFRRGGQGCRHHGDNDGDDTCHVSPEERGLPISGGNSSRKVDVNRYGRPKQRNVEESDVAAKRISFFPFQDSMQVNDIYDGAGRFERSLSPEHEEDDDFEDPPKRARVAKDVEVRKVFKESEARVSRKRIQTEREVAVRKREAAGRKPYYILVSGSGTPYGDGVTAWKAEVTKLSRALDPSICDIRHQPHHKIELLKKRLTDNFDYSGIIADKFLLPLLGTKVTARRCELMNIIKAGRCRPNGVDPAAWDRLTSISDSENFKRKSEAMRYANSCRRTIGRTGPGGEMRVQESLKTALCRSPDPDEVQSEMIRDKGYGGKKRKATEKGNPEEVLQLKSTCDDLDIGEKHLSKEDAEAQDGCGPSNGNKRKTLAEVDVNQMDVLKKMQLEIEYLRARLETNVTEPLSQKTEAAVQSATVTEPPS